MKHIHETCVYNCADFLKAICFAGTKIYSEKIWAMKCEKTLKKAEFSNKNSKHQEESVSLCNIPLNSQSFGHN